MASIYFTTDNNGNAVIFDSSIPLGMVIAYYITIFDIPILSFLEEVDDLFETGILPLNTIDDLVSYGNKRHLQNMMEILDDIYGIEIEKLDVMKYNNMVKAINKYRKRHK